VKNKLNNLKSFQFKCNGKFSLSHNFQRGCTGVHIEISNAPAMKSFLETIGIKI